MPKVKFNKLIDNISGRIGDLIFYQADGQNLSRTVPQATLEERSVKQEANSGRFTAAQRYAATALADPALKAAYKAPCRGHQNPRNLAIRDAMRPPVVGSINLEGYATDDFRVVEVKVTIRGSQGEVIEEGLAELKSDKGDWCYTARMEVPSGQTVSVTAAAKDNPGNMAESQRWQLIAVPVG
jgi:hypothetical protein